MSNSTVARITEDSLFLQQLFAAVSSLGWVRSHDPLPIDDWLFTGTVFCRPCAGNHNCCEFLSLETMSYDSISQPPPWWSAITLQHFTASSLMVNYYITASQRLFPDGWLSHHSISQPPPWWLAVGLTLILQHFTASFQMVGSYIPPASGQF